ncbi:MAG: bacteriohemerythrin [Candidatus Delongbacteria bacterium]|nr:bacteriohemerythrin [Candidatus Delongbacteria bacterium]MBN2834204.1 bacteriohemerythrin [Candidatus Delongbacteria bacterium]
MKIEWSSDFKLGHELIDMHHERLINLYNYLLDRIDFSDVYSKAVNELIDYADYHFKEEEKLMIENDYVEFKDHKILHDAFLKDLKENIVKADKNNIDEILIFLRAWIINHVLHVDRKLAIFLRSSNQSGRKTYII